MCHFLQLGLCIFVINLKKCFIHLFLYLFVFNLIQRATYQSLTILFLCYPDNDTEGEALSEKAAKVGEEALQTTIQQLEEELKPAHDTIKELSIQANISRFCEVRFSSDD